MFLALGFGTPSPVLAQEVNQVNTAYSSSTAELIVGAIAAHEGIDAKDLYNTLNCESGMQENAVGDHGTSFGVAQIHLPAHADISKAQASDPYFAIGWAAHQFKLGHQSMWTCWKERHGSEGS